MHPGYGPPVVWQPYAVPEAPQWLHSSQLPVSHMFLSAPVPMQGYPFPLPQVPPYNAPSRTTPPTEHCFLYVEGPPQLQNGWVGPPQNKPVDPEDQETTAILDSLMDCLDGENDLDERAIPSQLRVPEGWMKSSPNLSVSQVNFQSVGTASPFGSASAMSERTELSNSNIPVNRHFHVGMPMEPVKVEVGRAVPGVAPLGTIPFSPHWPVRKPEMSWGVNTDSVLWQCRMKTIPPTAAGEENEGVPVQVFATPVQWSVIENLVQGGSVRREALLLWPCCARPPAESTFLTHSEAEEWRKRGRLSSNASSSTSLAGSQHRPSRPRIAHPPALGADDSDEKPLEEKPLRRKPKMILPVGEEAPPNPYVCNTPYSSQ